MKNFRQLSRLIQRRFQNNIALKVARLVTPYVIGVGIILGSWQVYQEYSRLNIAINGAVETIIAVIEVPAAQAVYLQDEELAYQIANGLFQFNMIEGIKITDDLGTDLTSITRENPENNLEWLTKNLFGTHREIIRPLTLDKNNFQQIGELTVYIHPHEFEMSFLERATSIFGLIIIQTIVLSIVIFYIFYLNVTKPLTEIAASLNKIDPAEASNTQVLPPKDHETDELGSVTMAVNNLLISINNHISKRERAEKARGMSDAHLANILDIAVDAIVSVNEEQKIILFNKGAEILFGYQADEIIGQSLDILIPEDLIEVHKNQHVPGFTATPVASRHMYDRNTAMRKRKDGSLFPAESSISKFNLNGKTTYTAILRDITERKDFEEKIQAQVNRLAALREIDIAISGSVDLQITLNVILDQVCAKLHTDACNVLLFDSESQVLEYAAGRGFYSNAIKKSSLHLGQGVAGQTALNRKPIYIPDLSNSNFIRRDLLIDENFVSYYGTPLLSKGRVVGVLDIFQRSPLNPDEEWESFLETLSRQTSIAIDNALLFENLQRSNDELTLAYQSTLEGWSKALELRDDGTQGHTQRVTNMTIQLAKKMNIKGKKLLYIRQGALLHDIGKIAIPDSILLKSGDLNDDEWEIMKRHPQFAYDLLDSIEFLRPTLDIPYSHHEKWDGSGYPQGLKGKEIPLAARIFAVVDVWDALSSDRPYRKAWPTKKTVKYIKEESGGYFDPEIVEKFLDLLNGDMQI